MLDYRYFAFRRWVLARDPTARIQPKLLDDYWLCRVKTSKSYLKGSAFRRWGAAERNPKAHTSPRITRSPPPPACRCRKLRSGGGSAGVVSQVIDFAAFIAACRR